MQIGYNFDTHSFIKEFLNAKTEEEKAEILAKTISEIKNESNYKIELKFEKAKEDLVTKMYLDNQLKDMQIKIYLTIGGLGVFLTTVILGILPFILKQ